MEILVFLLNLLISGRKVLLVRTQNPEGFGVEFGWIAEVKVKGEVTNTITLVGDSSWKRLNHLPIQFIKELASELLANGGFERMDVCHDCCGQGIVADYYDPDDIVVGPCPHCGGKGCVFIPEDE